MKYIKEYKEYSINKDLIIVIDNTMPPEKKYLSNIINYLENSNIFYKIATEPEHILEYSKNYNIVGALSTGSDYRVNKDSNRLSYKALQYLECPILGLCFGFQSMAKFYGVEIQSESETKDNLYLTSFDESHFLFRDIDLKTTKVSFCFHDYPSEVPQGFTKIAEIDGKIAGISNTHLKRYGLLFHPEDLPSTHIILNNFIENL
jgi:GMP synthase (glutamine-hydrolysing)